MFKVLITSQLF